MKNIVFFSLSLFSIVFIGGCAVSMTPESRTLRSKQALTLTTLDGRESSYKAGENIPLPKEPSLIEAPGMVGLLVLPATSGSGVSEVNLRRMETWMGPDLNREVNERLNKVMERVFDAQRAISNRQGGEALRIVEELQNSYPELSYLDFLKASAYVLTGKRERARAAVTSGLSAFPANTAGQALQNSLNKGSNR